LDYNTTLLRLQATIKNNSNGILLAFLIFYFSVKICIIVYDIFSRKYQIYKFDYFIYFFRKEKDKHFLKNKRNCLLRRMTKDLTKGKIMPQLINFTIPLIIGNIFQLTYNAMDSIIVGRFVGPEALVAVGTANPITTLMINLLNGLCMGAGILMGVQFGAKDYKTLKRQISTTMLAGLIFSIFISLVCIINAPLILRLLQIHKSALTMGISYMRIVFLGLIFTYGYNFLSSTLRALGDSTTPLYFLIASAIINILGDLIFVIIFKMGSNGCAIATVLSEFLSVVFCLIYIKRKVPILNLGLSWFVFDKALLGKTVSYGWASAMQQATVQMGKIVIQAIANSMGIAVSAAFTIVNRIDDFAYTPEQNIGHAMTSFMAQNRGAKNFKRVKSGFLDGMKLELFYGVFILLVCYLLANPLMMLFTKDTFVIKEGVSYLHVIAFCYLLPAMTNGVQGFFRGMGDLKVTLISSFVNMFVRVIAASILVFIVKAGIVSFPYGYLVGWIGMLLAETPLLIKNLRNWDKLESIAKE